MILDNIIIFLNVLEQFAIRVTIFDISVEDIIKYVNKLYFNNDDLIKKILTDNISNENIINPELIVKDYLKDVNQQILNENVNFEKLKFSNIHYKDGYTKFIF